MQRYCPWLRIGRKNGIEALARRFGQRWRSRDLGSTLFIGGSVTTILCHDIPVSQGLDAPNSPQIAVGDSSAATESGQEPAKMPEPTEEPSPERLRTE